MQKTLALIFGTKAILDNWHLQMYSAVFKNNFNAVLKVRRLDIKFYFNSKLSCLVKHKILTYIVCVFI